MGKCRLWKICRMNFYSIIEEAVFGNYCVQSVSMCSWELGDVHVDIYGNFIFDLEVRFKI